MKQLISKQDIEKIKINQSNTKRCNAIECEYNQMDYPGETNCTLFNKWLYEDSLRCDECLQIIPED